MLCESAASTNVEKEKAFDRKFAPAEDDDRDDARSVVPSVQEPPLPEAFHVHTEASDEQDPAYTSIEPAYDTAGMYAVLFDVSSTKGRLEDRTVVSIDEVCRVDEMLIDSNCDWVEVLDAGCNK